jgi:hypothetical protein
VSTINKEINPIKMLIIDWENQFQQGIKELKNVGVTKLGFICNHIYMGTKNPLDFKGMDKIIYAMFVKYCKNVAINNLGLNHSSHEYFYEELLPLISHDSSFQTCYNEIIENSEEIENAAQITNREENNHIIEDLPIADQTTPYSEIELSYDKEGKYKAINHQFLLGDTVLLQGVRDSRGKRLIFGGNEELSTGNEGFYGAIYETLAILSEF